MSKANSSPSTAVPASKSRRAVILGAGGLAAAGALLTLPALASTRTPSPELIEYRRRKAIWNACFDQLHEEDDAWEGRVAETSDAVEEVVEGFLVRAKAPRSWDDVIEIAEVQFTELWDIEDDELHQHSDHEDVDAMLLRAVLAVGGIRVEPKPEPEVPAGSVVKLSNRPYAAERPSYWTDYDIVWAGLLIGHFRRTDKAAKYFDVPEAVILGWIRTDYIPPAWHPKVYAILEEAGQTIAPHILGLAEDALPRRPAAEGGAHA